MHDLAGIPPIGLQQEGLLVITATLAHRVIEKSLGTVVHEIDLSSPVSGCENLRLCVGT
jgi:hypothetical protein